MSDQRPAITLRAAEVGHASAAPPTQDVTITGTPRRVRPGGARDAGAAAAVTIAPDEIVRVEYDNDLVLWIRADDLLRERGRKNVARGDGGEVWDIDTSARVGLLGDAAGAARGTERGMVGLGIKVLEFFGVDLHKKSAAIIGKAFEERQLKGATPGRLHRCNLGSAAAMVPVADGAKSLPAGEPLLVFLHGTMSSVKGSFGALWKDAKDDGGAAAAAREAIKARYGANVYAFEHRTLTESPIRNALDLVEQLPVGAQLHLVSHSRGGLVGELLCLAERDRSDDPLKPELLKALFAADRTLAEQIGLGPLDGEAAKARDAVYAEDRERLLKLLALMDERRITVKRFVRVACPARGTTLASGRLDRWLSVVDLLTGHGLIGEVADFLFAVVKQRTDPRTLPGVEAMMPGSALTRLLQHPALVTTADLSVIGGDVEGDGLWSQLKLLAVDWFYGAEHDLVVNTGSMMGGLRRRDGAARFLRDQGPEVTHFNYFANRKSLGWMLAGLARDDGATGGFAPIAQAVQEEPRWRSAVRASRSVATPRPIALVIPGTMGSALNVKGQPVWLAYWALLRGGLGDIAWGATDVAPVDLLDDFYGPLLEHLARTHRVEIHPLRLAQLGSRGREGARGAARRAAARRGAHEPAGAHRRALDGRAGDARDDRRRRRRRTRVAPHHRAAGQPLADAGHAQPRLARGGALAHRLQPDRGEARVAGLHARRQRRDRCRASLPRASSSCCRSPTIRTPTHNRARGRRCAARSAPRGRRSRNPCCALPARPGRCCATRRSMRTSWSTSPAASAPRWSTTSSSTTIRHSAFASRSSGSPPARATAPSAGPPAGCPACRCTSRPTPATTSSAATPTTGASSVATSSC